jgi:hypothetical protein
VKLTRAGRRAVLSRRRTSARTTLALGGKTTRHSLTLLAPKRKAKKRR